MAAFQIWRYPMVAAQLAVREGIPENQAYDVLKTLGMDVSPDTFGRLYGQSVRAAGMVDLTSGLALDEYPTSDVIQTRSTVTSTGYLYQFSVSQTDLDSGQDFESPYSITTGQLITPGEGIDAAIVSQTLRAADYNLKVMGARLTGIFQLVPLEQ